MNMRISLLAVGSMVLAVALAGCSASSDGLEVATAQSPVATMPGGASSPAPAKVSDYDKALRFTRCMNENGEKIPDPVEGEPLRLGTPRDGVVSVSTPAFDKCRHFLPAAWPVKADPVFIAQHRAWGECMRKHGVDTPELSPDANGMVNYQPDPYLHDTPEWRAASAACQSVDNPDSVPLSEE